MFRHLTRCSFRLSANYFCAYSQLYHQKQMLTDHNRMAAYHAGKDSSQKLLFGFPI